MSRKIFEETVKKKIDRKMKSWPSHELSRDDCRLLAKRVAKGIRIEPPDDQRGPECDGAERRSNDNG